MEDADDEGVVKFVAARSLSCSYTIIENRALKICRDPFRKEDDNDDDDRSETIGEWAGEWSAQSTRAGRIFRIDDAVSDLLENGALDPTGLMHDRAGGNRRWPGMKIAEFDRTLAEDQGEGRQSLPFASHLSAEESGPEGGFGGEELEPQVNRTPTLDVESDGSATADEENKSNQRPGRGYGDDYSEYLDIDYFHDKDGIRKSLIKPIDPKRFSICGWCDTSEYLIFLAIKQKIPSTFQDSVERAALNVDADFNRDYLVPMGFRHIPMLVVNLTPEQVHGLKFSGELPMTALYLEGGWAEQLEGKPFECSVGIKRESQEELRRLLARVDGLPPMEEDDGDLMCNRIPLFCFQGCHMENGSDRRTVGYDVREEFRNLRMRPYNWWCVVGSSLRVKEVDAPFDNFRVLGDAVSPKCDAEGDEDATARTAQLDWDCDDEDDDEDSEPSRLKHLLE